MDNLKQCKHCKSDINKKAKVCPNCRKKQGGKGKFIVLGVVIFFILVGALGNKEDDQTDTANKTPAKEASVNTKDNAEKKEEPKEEVKVDDTIKFGEVGQSKDLSLKINEVGEKDTIKENDFLSYTPDSGKYAIVNITISNTGKEAVSLTNGYFKLLTADDAEYKPTFLIGLDNKYISFESINPGLDVTGNLVFEIPSDIDVTDMTLRFSGTGLFTAATKFSLK